MQSVLISSVVKIRRYDSVDVSLLFDAVRESIPELSRWLPWCHSNYSLAESLEWVLNCKKFWQEGLEYNFGIFDRHTEIFLGGVGLNQIDRAHRLANLGYWVRTSATGKGIATAAAGLAAQFGFQELGLNRLEITVAVENRASQRVAERLGAVREGILRQRLILQGRPHDACLYSLLAEQWRLSLNRE